VEKGDTSLQHASLNQDQRTNGQLTKLRKVLMNNPDQEQIKQTSEMSTKMQSAWAGTHIEYGLYQIETMRN
jgi:hypothetical protein